MSPEEDIANARRRMAERSKEHSEAIRKIRVQAQEREAKRQRRIRIFGVAFFILLGLYGFYVYTYGIRPVPECRAKCEPRFGEMKYQIGMGYQCVCDTMREVR